MTTILFSVIGLLFIRFVVTYTTAHTHTQFHTLSSENDFAARGRVRALSPRAPVADSPPTLRPPPSNLIIISQLLVLPVRLLESSIISYTKLTHTQHNT